MSQYVKCLWNTFEYTKKLGHLKADNNLNPSLKVLEMLLKNFHPKI